MPILNPYDSGLEFINFLEVRISNFSIEELRCIYNNEFRNRDERKHPKFSRIMSTLLDYNKVYVREGRFYNVSFQRPTTFQRHSRRNAAHGSAESPPTVSFCMFTSTKERAAAIRNMMKGNRRHAISDKEEIFITSDPKANDGTVQLTVNAPEKPLDVMFHIKNKGKNNIRSTSYIFFDRTRCFTFKDENRGTKPDPKVLHQGENHTVVVCCNPNMECGYFPATICFEFVSELPKPRTFWIIREINVVVQTSLASELGPVAPYKRLPIRLKPPAFKVEEGTPPKGSAFQHMPTVEKLREYKCPPYLRRQIKLSAGNKKLLKSPLDMKSYSCRFHLLLHLEEVQMEMDIGKYNLHDVTMNRDKVNKNLLILKVPGIAENRPSVLQGDCLKVTRSGDGRSVVYKGYVHKIELDSVKLGFSKKFLETFIPKMKFDVEFTINRLTMKLQHRAVDLVVKYNLEKVLFPTCAELFSVSIPELRFFNCQLEKNPEQRKAVDHIVAGSSKPAPYIIFGPPGTGKTITVVESIAQIQRIDKSAHILACAPSNNAADLLCERLKRYIDSHQLYRMYASSRDGSVVPNSLQKICNWNETHSCFEFPKMSVLQKYKVIVTTLYTAGRLVTAGFPVGHFTHVFVDEAGQAEEPQCVIAIAGLLCAGKGQLVLAGDPKQLGPIIRSSHATDYELGLSLLERLMKHKLYQNLNPCYVTKLLRNYRSHGAILKIPNEKFYSNELLVFADQMERETYCKWEALPQKGFPVIFHGVLGKDQREANSPSFFNVSEIEVLLKYLKKLQETQRQKGLPKLSAKDIGIITPYRKQVEKIRKVLWSVGDLQELKVGSVEEFQGQERRIIMVSTVRSSLSYVELDEEFNIGFLSNEKRFNVAMTRAKALLIVVGNPMILRKDPIWKKFIDYCVEMKGYVGVNLSDGEEDKDD